MFYFLIVFTNVFVITSIETLHKYIKTNTFSWFSFVISIKTRIFAAF